MAKRAGCFAAGENFAKASWVAWESGVPSGGALGRSGRRGVCRAGRGSWFVGQRRCLERACIVLDNTL